MADRVTIYDIAREAGVGIATVSRVLNGDPHVRATTRASVQDAIANLGYRPSRAARRLAQGGPSRPRVAALVPFFTAAFYFAVTRSLAHGLKAADIDLVIHDIKSREDKNRILDRLLAERACEAVVLISCGIGAERQEQLDRLGVPAVCADYRCEGVPSVCIDNGAGGRLAAQHLLVRGSRNPGLIGGPTRADTLTERELAYVEKLRLSLGLAVPVKRAGAVGQEAGKIAMLEMLEDHPDVDAVFCVNDMLAIGALEALREAGIRVPEQVQVIGFDDQPLMDFVGLSTVSQPIAKMGRWAATAVTKRLDRRGPTPRSTTLQVELKARTTTRNPVA